MTALSDQDRAETFSSVVDAMEKQKLRLKRDLEADPSSSTLPRAIQACDELVELARMVLAPQVH